MRAVLFDRELHYAASGAGGSANANFDAPEAIREQVRRCIEPCLAACEPGSIARAYLTSLGAADPFMELVREHSPDCEAVFLTEGEACVRAGLLRAEGTAALAGTGSIAFGIADGVQAAAGGWGSWIGDEGSGLDIGRRAFAAALRAAEGRGPETALGAALVDGFGAPSLEELAWRLYAAPSARSFIAAACPIAAACARTGDAVAARLFEDAGEELASLAGALLAQRPELLRRPVVAAGGAWKGDRRMFERFAHALTARFPGVDVALPAYEPVIGGVVEEARALYAVAAEHLPLPDEAQERLAEQFGAYRYRTAWDEEPSIPSGSA